MVPHLLRLERCSVAPGTEGDEDTKVGTKLKLNEVPSRWAEAEQNYSVD